MNFLERIDFGSKIVDCDLGRSEARGENDEVVVVVVDV